METMETIIIENPTLDDACSDEVCRAKSVKIKLTPKQNMVIYCLQQGFVIIAGPTMPRVCICNNDVEFDITISLFYKLVNMGLIYQSNRARDNHDWMLTELGKKTITKSVNI